MKRLEWVKASAIVRVTFVGLTLISGADAFAKGGGHSHGRHSHSSTSHSAKSHHETHHAAPGQHQAHHAAPAHHETQHVAPNKHSASLLAGPSHVAPSGTAGPAVTNGAPHRHHHGWNNGYWNNGYWDGWGIGSVAPGVAAPWYDDGFYGEGPMLGGLPSTGVVPSIGLLIAPDELNAAILPAPSCLLMRRPSGPVEPRPIDDNNAQ